MIDLDRATRQIEELLAFCVPEEIRVTRDVLEEDGDYVVAFTSPGDCRFLVEIGISAKGEAFQITGVWAPPRGLQLDGLVSDTIIFRRAHVFLEALRTAGFVEVST